MYAIDKFSLYLLVIFNVLKEVIVLTRTVDMTHVFVLLSLSLFFCLTINILICTCTAVWGRWAMPAYVQSKRILPFGFAGQCSSITSKLFLCCFHVRYYMVSHRAICGRRHSALCITRCSLLLFFSN